MATIGDAARARWSTWEDPEWIDFAARWFYEAAADVKDHYLHGIVTRVISLGLSGGSYRYKIELRPWVWLLSQVTDCRIFQARCARVQEVCALRP